MAGGGEASLTLGLGEGTGEEAAAREMVPERGRPGTEELWVTGHLLPGAKRAAWDLAPWNFAGSLGGWGCESGFHGG